MPLWIFYPLVFISLALPNLIYSGSEWFDTLHIMKWAWTMVPVAVIALIGGSMLALFGAGRTGFRLDLFGAVWLGLLAFVTLQTLWCDVFAWSTYFKEWFFLASLLAAYIFCYALFDSQAALRRVLWLANLNAAVNVVFAELLIRGMNDICPLIMNVPGNYIGNTGQQEMFGLWMAMAAMNGIYLHMAYSPRLCGGVRRKFLIPANLFMLAFNSWGLWNSTTRAGMLALFTGTAALALTARNRREEGRALARRIGAAFALVVFMLAVNICTAYFGWSRAYALINKTSDMLLNTSNIGARREIWITSWNVFKLHPLAGTGLGHYKWHYLEGQREAFKTHPGLKWQFTYWAHSEYLQLLAELGIFGAAALAAAGAWWLWSFARALTARRTLSPGAMWGCATLFLIWSDALFSRPFHRVENAIWMSLAFAWANREILTAAPLRQEIRCESVYRVFGIFAAAVAAAGLNRRFLCVDQSPLAIATTGKRLAQSTAGKPLDFTFDVEAPCGADDCAVEAEVFPAISSYTVRLISFENADTQAMGINGLDAVDQWSCGFVQGDTYRRYASSVRSVATPALAATLEMPVCAGEPCIMIVDIWGSRRFYLPKRRY